MSVQQPPMFLSDDAFELLVLRAPQEVLRGLKVEDFEAAIGTSRERFESIVTAMSADGRTQGFIGQETARYLSNALGVVILELEPAAFEARTGVSRQDAMNLMQELLRRTETAASGDTGEAS